MTTIKCTICYEDFAPHDLVAVFEHEHMGLNAPVDVSGVFVKRQFSAEQSSNIGSIHLDRNNQSIDVTYRNGNIYRWLDVPIEVLETAEHAPSIGAWINRTLKGSYRYYHVNGD